MARSPAFHRPQHAAFVREVKNTLIFPRVLAEKMKQPGGKSELFQDWFKNCGKWSKVLATQRRKIVKKSVARDKWGWEMKNQLLKRYDDDSAFVNKLIANKVKDGLWKRNPESPDREDHILYFIRMESSVIQENISQWEFKP